MKPKRVQALPASPKAAVRQTSPLSAVLRTRWRTRAVLLALALVAYANSFGLRLAQDSQAIITEDARIREVSLENLKLIAQKDYWWPKPGDWLYRPVTTASLLVNYAVLGNETNPAGYHWVNFLLHTVNGWLVYELALLLLRREAPAFFAAALWAVHPIGTECVTNIVGRADLLAAMAVLGGLLLYVRSTAFQGRRLAGSAAGLFAIATAGTFAKESAAVLLGVMLLWDLTFGTGEWRAGMRRRAPAYAAVAASLGVIWIVRRQVFAALPWPQVIYPDNMLRAADFWTARLTAIKVIGLDLWLLVCPMHLSCDRSYNQIPLSAWSDPAVWAALAAIAAMLGVALAMRRRNPLIFWLAGFTGITLLPTSNLVFLIATVMGERFLYLPAVALALGVAAVAYRSQPRRAAAMLGVLIVLGAGRTFARNADWNGNLALASADVRTAPRSVRLHDMLAKALFDEDAQRNIDRAIREQEAAWAILAPLPPALSAELPPARLGIYYSVKAGLLGSPANDQSRPWYEKSVAVLLRAREISRAAEKAFDETQLAHGKPLAVRTASQLLYLTLANDYLNLGRPAEALEALRYGRDLEPHSREVYDGMVLAHLALGDAGSAAVALDQKGLVDGFQPATLAAIREVYARIPEGACAVGERSGAPSLNPDCPRLRTDLCAASADLAQAYLHARMPGEAGAVRESAAERYGCGTGSQKPGVRSQEPGARMSGFRRDSRPATSHSGFWLPASGFLPHLIYDQLP